LLQTFGRRGWREPGIKARDKPRRTLEGCHPGRLTSASFAREKREFKALGILTLLSRVPM